MKNLIKKISILLMLNSYAFCDVQIKVDYDSYSMDNLTTNTIATEIIRNINSIYFNEQKFTLKIKCTIDARGNFNYRFISESKSGYENKVLIMSKLEKQKTHSYENYMKMIQKINKDYEYKDLIFDFEVINN